MRRVAPSCHDNYGGATNWPRLHEGTRAKVVYHKDGGQTHCFRMANAADDSIENYTGRWFIGNLIGWRNWPNTGLRDRLANFHQGASPKLRDGVFAGYLREAAGNQVPGFNPDVDG